MSTRQPSLKLPIFSRSSKLQVSDTSLPPSVIPEHLRAPPGTPTSDLPNLHTESDSNDTHDEGPHGSRTVGNDSQENSSSETPEPRRTERKSRKGGKKKSTSTTLTGAFHPTLVLENSGSVARDHLASERTFLAYVRTSLLLASSGVALVQLFAVASANANVGATLGQVRKFARPLGATMVIFGLSILALGVRRYFLIQKYLTQGRFPVTRFTIAAMSTVTAIIILIVFVVLVSARS